MEAFYEDAPPFVAFAEVDGAVHCLHSFRKQPVTGNIEEHVGGLLVVDAIEETDASDGDVVAFVFIPFIDESGDAADGFVVAVFEDPAGAFSVSEGFVLFGVEDFVDLGVDGPDIAGVALVEVDIDLDKFFCLGR